MNSLNKFLHYESVKSNKRFTESYKKHGKFFAPLAPLIVNVILIVIGMACTSISTNILNTNDSNTSFLMAVIFTVFGLVILGVSIIRIMPDLLNAWFLTKKIHYKHRRD